jgi:hypothetical protein
MSTTTTTDPTLDQRATDYLDAVRSHLADLPADERDDLLDDLEAHVHQVAATTEGPLDDALGPPATFAAELRASAGLAPAARGSARLDRWRRRGDALQDHPWTRATVAFLPELRPAWWVARGWLLVWLAAEATGGDHSAFPLPELFGNAFVGLVATVPVVAWSVRLGRNPSPPRWRWVVNACAVLGALLVLQGAGHDDDPVRYDVVEAPGFAIPPDAAPGSLWRSDGSPVTDLYAYGPDGQPTDQVVIVDQEGTPYEIDSDPAWPTIPRDFWPRSDAEPSVPTTAGGGPATAPTTAPTTVPPTAPAPPTTVPSS